MRRSHLLIIAALAALSGVGAQAGPPERARDLGIPFEGTPGALNAITDIPGVEVGQITLISGQGALKVGQGPVRTGVTVVLPRGRASVTPVNGGMMTLNGNGEMTGQSYLQDFGLIHGPIGLSDTNAIGQVYAGIMQWSQQHFGAATWPVVAETWSGYLSDLEGFHVTPGHAVQAIKAARPGPVAEGNVGGGTGMVCFGFKGGVGTASRLIQEAGRTYTVGVLVQCNTGQRDGLRIAGAPVGQEIAARWLPCYAPDLAPPGKSPLCGPGGAGGEPRPDAGSIIIVVGTDAPLQPTQLNRLAKRAAMGLARLGSFAGNSSGDIIVSFSTAPGVDSLEETQFIPAQLFPNGHLDGVFKAAVEATEEAIVNALVGAQTMTGADGHRVYALPHDALKTILARYGRLAAPQTTAPHRP